VEYNLCRKKIEEFLSLDNFCWIIKDSFTHRELASFIERVGISYQGVRTVSVPHNQLAWDLAEEAMRDKEIFKLLFRKLNSANISYIEKIHSLGEAEVKRYLEENIIKIYLEKEVGNIIWALIVDEREEINRITFEFIRKIEKVDAEVGEEEITSKVIEKTFMKMLEKMKNKWIKERMKILERKNKDLGKTNKILFEENKNLKQSLDKKNRRIKELSRMCAELSSQKGILNKTLQKKEERIKRLEGEIKLMKEKLKIAPQRALKTSLHNLEKENRKLSYELKKAKTFIEENLQRLEKERLFLKKQLEEEKERRKRLEEEFEEVERKALRLELSLKKKEEKETKRSLYILPHKGNRVGIFIDVQNVYYSAKKQYGKKVDYSKLLWYLVRGRHLVKAICYIVQHP
jgi:hypothetical protein